MPRVTALRAQGGGKVRVELDGLPWRTLPAVAVVSAGVWEGVELDRPRARDLRRALRRVEALAAATSALSRRDHSIAGLDAVLERRGIASGDRVEAAETLTRLGYLNDPNVALRRAESMAARGYGDEAIRFDLANRGLGEESIEPAISGLEPEADRARALVARLETVAKAARQLASKGFSAESIESAVGVFEE